MCTFQACETFESCIPIILFVIMVLLRNLVIRPLRKKYQRHKLFLHFEIGFIADSTSDPNSAECGTSLSCDWWKPGHWPQSHKKVWIINHFCIFWWKPCQWLKFCLMHCSFLYIEILWKLGQWPEFCKIMHVSLNHFGIHFGTKLVSDPKSAKCSVFVIILWYAKTGSLVWTLPNSVLILNHFCNCLDENQIRDPNSAKCSAFLL